MTFDMDNTSKAKRKEHRLFLYFNQISLEEEFQQKFKKGQVKSQISQYILTLMKNLINNLVDY